MNSLYSHKKASTLSGTTAPRSTKALRLDAESLAKSSRRSGDPASRRSSSFSASPSGTVLVLQFRGKRFHLEKVEVFIDPRPVQFFPMQFH